MFKECRNIEGGVNSINIFFKYKIDIREIIVIPINKPLKYFGFENIITYFDRVVFKVNMEDRKQYNSYYKLDVLVRKRYETIGVSFILEQELKNTYVLKRRRVKKGFNDF